MTSTYPRPQFSVDEWVFIILKCRETSYVLETRSNQMFSKAVSESVDGVDKPKLTIMDKYIETIQDVKYSADLLTLL